MMKKNLLKSAAACGLCLTLLSASVSAAYSVPAVRTFENRFPQQTMNQLPKNQQQNPDFNKMDGRMIISEPGDYTLTGDMRGTVLVDPGEGEVKLTLDGAKLDGADGPAVAAISGDKLTIELPAGSVNTIAGGAGNTYGATIYSEIPVFFEGDGRLDIAGKGQNAIRVEDSDLSFNGGDIRVDAAQNGFDANNVNFNGGTVALDAARNDFAPGVTQNQNGGFFNQNWTPGNDFMQAQQPSGLMNGQLPTMPGNVQNSSQFGPGAMMGEQNGNQFGPGAMTGEQNGNQFGPGTMMGEQNSNQFAPGAMMGDQNSNQTAPSAPMGGQNSSQTAPSAPSGEQNSQMSGGMQINTATQSSGTATEVVTGTVTNSAIELEADYENATTIVVSNDNSTVKIDESGTYVVTGSSDDGSITVKKGTTDVVLVLDNLDLTSTSGAALSINKEAEVQVVISGTVTLTDNENPDDEYSTDADVADAYDGAAIKVKAGATVYITGSGTLNVNGNAKNGIKAGDEASLIIGGEDLTVNVNAVNDGINGNYDVTILSGTVNVSAGDDGIHADRVLTIGDEKTHTGPNLTVSKSNEGLEGTIVNIAGGKINVTSTDDAINAANADGVYEDELDYSVNITGGEVTVNAGNRSDGVDSNGNVNLVDGSLNIRSSAANGPDAGIDYDGSYYVSDSFSLNNPNGVAGPDNMIGGPGMGGQMGGQSGNMGGGFGGPSGSSGAPSDMGGFSGGSSNSPSDMGGEPGPMGR